MVDVVVRGGGAGEQFSSNRWMEVKDAVQDARKEKEKIQDARS